MFVDELDWRLTLCIVTTVVQYICVHPRLCAQCVRPSLQEKQIRSWVERFCKNWPRPQTLLSSGVRWKSQNFCLYLNLSKVYSWICVDLAQDAVIVLPNCKLFTIPTKALLTCQSQTSLAEIENIIYIAKISLNYLNKTRKGWWHWYGCDERDANRLDQQNLTLIDHSNPSLSSFLSTKKLPFLAKKE